MPLAAPEPGASPRVRLARLAREAALAVPGVLGAETGRHGVRVTADPSSGLLRGVSVTARGDGRYAVDLRLVAAMVPLVPLAERVRERVAGAAAAAGLTDALGGVDVEWSRVSTEAEEAAPPPPPAPPAVEPPPAAEPPVAAAVAPPPPRLPEPGFGSSA